MTMFYYADDETGSFLPGSSGHFAWNYTELSKCKLPYGGPTWCMTESMANATYRGFNVPHHSVVLGHVPRGTALRPAQDPYAMALVPGAHGQDGVKSRLARHWPHGRHGIPRGARCAAGGSGS